jgi:predicted AAA+ superfamily ATPase
MRLRKTPKRLFTDPSLAISALQATPSTLAHDPRTLGALFENLCLRDLAVYADALNANLTHYHDDTGLEIDAILELDSRWAAIEIKLGAHRVEEGAAALKRLSNKLTKKGAPAPDFLAILTNGGPVYTRDDGIHVIPIDCIRP